MNRYNASPTTRSGIYLYTFLLCNCLQFSWCSGRDYITPENCLSDASNETLESAGQTFQLGFFTPSEGGGRYIGIWYKKDPGSIVWVANRGMPVRDGHGVFGIDKEDGNIKVWSKNSTYFNTGISNSRLSLSYKRRTKPNGTANQTVTPIAKLNDYGNLVLMDSRTGKLWESFKFPTDTFLPHMYMDDNLKLTSWRSRDDPANGNFTFQKDADGNSNDVGYKITKSMKPYYWKRGVGSSKKSFIPYQMNQFAAALLIRNTSDRNFEINSRLLMNYTGKIQYLSWNVTWNRWDLKWSEPQGPCDVDNVCGNFGICNSNNSSTSIQTDEKKMCTCVKGFEPSSPKDWKMNDFSSGCKISGECSPGSKTEFITLNVKRVTPYVEYGSASSEENCISECRATCDCRAYSYKEDSNRNINRCWIWHDDLSDIQDSNGSGHNIFIRSPGPVESGGGESRTGNKNSTSRFLVTIFITTIVASALLCSITYIAYSRMKNKKNEKESRQEKPVFSVQGRDRLVEELIDEAEQFGEDDKKDIEVPFFEFESILAATDNFSQENKIGQGGFGPVYKGKFLGGKEIAVKRLSTNSAQGLKEFKNEVVLIAKLQHRNLVRLLGYCIIGNEKILLYEYMSNKSLDAFIFDEKLSMLLDWTKRFDIIVGVARGLLYLHEDSRLRIIHRDMKASNILLDEEMNPKISDFGLARIVGGRETKSNTSRVVGTYGYMSPEYVLEGQFSVKSDVFSFGVVLLEIISGKRNTGFYQSQLVFNLLGYAWNLWEEEKALALLDQKLVESCNEREVLKCIIIGLLCVQEDPGDRPTMSKVLFMLRSEMETLPNPKKPAFISRKRISDIPSSSSTIPELATKNEITFSLEVGR